jgi:large subunit ribosomal protein L28
MPRECEFCHKRTTVGRQYTRRGLAKKKGGVGRKITGNNKRKFHANLQKVRAVVDGSVRRVRICTRCIKSGKLRKPTPRDAVAIAAAKGAAADS